MKTIDTEEILMVRLYVAGSVNRRELLLRRLQHWEQLRGATMIEAIGGFGTKGVASGDIVPTIIEFFDSADIVQKVIEDIHTFVDHIVFWPANTVAPTSPP